MTTDESQTTTDKSQITTDESHTSHKRLQTSHRPLRRIIRKVFFEYIYKTLFSVGLPENRDPEPQKNRKTGTLARPQKNRKIGTLEKPKKRDPSGTLLGPQKNWKTGTLLEPQKNRDPRKAGKPGHGPQWDLRKTRKPGPNYYHYYHRFIFC